MIKVSGYAMTVDKAALLDGEQRLKTLRRTMDFAAALLWQSDLILAEVARKVWG